VAVKAHVRSFVAPLSGAAPLDPVPLADSLAELPGIVDWVGVVDELRVGHGAVSMHRRHHGAPPPLDLPGVDDFEALLLCAGCLHARVLVDRGYAPTAPSMATDAPRWLQNLLRMEPDFLDELLLELAARRATDPALADALTAQAQALRDAGAALHHQGRALLGGRTTMTGLLRTLVGAGPDLARGEWVRWCRAVVVLVLLDGKG